MKTKVIIEDGHAQIELTAENDFEKDIIEKICDNNWAVYTKASRDYSYGVYKNHKIFISYDKNV